MLRRLGEEILILDRPCLVTKKVIRVITSLCNEGDIQENKLVRYEEVKTLTNWKGFMNIYNLLYRRFHYKVCLLWSVI